MSKKDKGFVFHESIWSLLTESGIETKDTEKMLYGIVRYGITGIEPECKSPIEKVIFEMAKRDINKSLNSFKTCQKNGRKGGAPKGNRNNPYGRKGKPMKD